MHSEKVTQRRRLSRWKFPLLAAIVVLSVAFGILWAKLRPRSYPSPSETGIRTQVFQPPDSYSLSTRVAPKAARDHLLDANFALVNQVSQIPESCVSPFDSSFTNAEGTRPQNKIVMADPGKPFQYSDAIVPGLPFRRLVFAGTGPNRCFIYYQHGGAMYPSYCLAIMDTSSSSNVVWVGESRKEADTVRELRSMLSGGEFSDTAGPVC